MYFGLSTRITRSGGDSPALALDLLSEVADSRLAFSRASAATDIINGIITTFTSDMPRLSATNGLLIEGSRTNMAKNTVAGTYANMTPTTGQSDPANGTQATLWSQTAGTLTAYANICGVDNTTAALVYTSSAFVKAAGSTRYVQWLAAGSATAGYANFDLLAGSVSASGGGVSNVKIQSIGNGWYRIAMTFTAVGAGVSGTVKILKTGVEARGVSCTYDGTEGLYTFGVQQEQGVFATSYIPTTTAAATRAADLCSVDVSGYNLSSEGTLWVEAKPNDSDPAATTSPRVANINNGSTSYHEVKRNAADTMAQAGTSTGGVTQSGLSDVAWISGTVARASYAWKANDMAFCFAGGTVASDATSPDGMPSGLTTLRIGANSATSGFFYGWVRGLRLWTRRLSNEQLKAVTQ